MFFVIIILLSILLVVLVGMQLLVFVKYGHINDDDAYYVCCSNIVLSVFAGQNEWYRT